MIWLHLLISYVTVCASQNVAHLISRILNWYKYSPNSLNVDSCLGLQWAASFHSSEELNSLVEKCVKVTKRSDPEYFKSTQEVFSMKWEPIEELNSRKMMRPAKSWTRTKFDEDFSDKCFAQIKKCHLSHPCVRYIFSPPGRRYFVTHQLLLSYAYRLNCPRTTVFWKDLKINEKLLCGSIHREMTIKSDSLDLRLEELLFCGMAGFKGFQTDSWKDVIAKSVSSFEKGKHQLGCVKHKTARKEIRPKASHHGSRRHRQTYKSATRFGRNKRKYTYEQHPRKHHLRSSGKQRSRQRSRKRSHRSLHPSRRRMRVVTDEFGCDSHSTALLIANIMLFK